MPFSLKKIVSKWNKNKIKDTETNNNTIDYLGFNRKTHIEYSIKQYHNLQLVEWLVKNNDLIEEGQPIAQIKNLGKQYKIPAPENGIIEFRFAPNSVVGFPTQKDQIFFALYANEENQIQDHISDFNVVSANSFNDYYLPKFHFKKIKEWLIKDGQSVKKGDQIMVVKKSIDNALVSDEFEYLMFAPEAGIVEILTSGNFTRIDKEKPIFSIYQNINKKLQNRYNNTHRFEVDEFTNTNRLYWTAIGMPDETRNQNHIYSGLCNIGLNEQWIVLPHELGVVPENIDGKDYLRLIFKPKDANIKKSDKLLIRMETNEILTFELNIESQVIAHKRKAFNIPVTIEELELLSNYKVEAIRIQRNDDVDLDINRGRDWYSKKEDFQYVIIQLFKQYLTIIKEEINNHQPLSIEERQSSKNHTF